MTELPEQPFPAAASRPDQASILLVDDNPANLLSLRVLLDDLSQNLVEARSGEEAIERVKVDEFAVILLDIRMPGISGFDTAKLIRVQEQSQHTPIIFLTASDIDRPQMEEGYALGAVDFLVKPILPVALQAKVRGFVQLFQDKQRAKHEADQLRMLVQGTTEYAIFMLDPNGQVLTWNAGAERIKQYKADEIIGQHFTKFYPQEAIDRGWPAHELKVAKAEGRFEDEGWRIRKDGTHFWANVVITALRDEQGKLRGFSKVTRDLTARREAEEALRHSEERFRLLVETAKDYAIFVLDPQGFVGSWNAGAERIKGYKADEIIGQHFSKFYPQEALDRGWPKHELKIAGEVGRFEDEGWRVRKDGSQFWANVVITALRGEHGELRGFSKITRDMSERKRSEENARRLAEEAAARQVAHQERERLHVTLASIGDAVISTDAEGRVDFLNSVAEELVGWKKEEAAHHSLSDVFCIVNEDTRQPVENPALRALKDGVVVGLANHTVLIARDGTERPIDDSAAPIRDAEGKIVGSVLVFRDVSEQRRAVQASRRNQELLQLIHKIGKIGHWEWNSLTDENNWSPEIEALYGLPSGGFEGGYQGWAKLLHPDDLPKAEGDVRRAMETGEYFSEFRVIWPDGSVHWLETRAHVFKDNQDQPVRIMGVNMDITERKRQQAAIQESEQRFRGLMEQAPFSIQVLTPSGFTVRVNQAWEKLWGITLDQIADYNMLEDPQLEDQGVLEFIRRGFGGESAYVPAIQYDPNKTVPDRSSDGDPRRWVAAVIYPLKDATGKTREVVLVHDDITARKKAEEALLVVHRELEDRVAARTAELVRANEFLKALLENVQTGVVACDAQGVLTLFNGVTRELHGLSEESISSEQWAERYRLYQPDGETPMARDDVPLYRALQGERLRDAEMVIAPVDMPLRIVLNSGQAFYDAQGEKLGAVVSMQDITARKKAEAGLRQAHDELERRVQERTEQLARANEALQQADRRKDEFLATLAHELRNPLAPIRNSLQILKMPRIDVKMAEQTREMMERQVHHLVRLVDDLLDVSRVMRGKIELRKERIELATVVARAIETVQPLIEVQGHNLHISMAKESLLLDADPVRLTQVVGNLLTNAAKYTDPQGQIWLVAKRSGDQVMLTIRDTGIGIAPDMLPHVFELFVQADHASTKAQGGLGIGLTLVKNLVEMHGGSVDAHSGGLGSGSEFTVRLPLMARPPQKSDDETTAELPQAERQSGHRILVVDDNQDAAISLSMLLRLQGHEVRVTHNGASALELAASFRPSVIFLDIGMPGMDGYEVARRVRNTPDLENTILAALTGWGQQEDRRRTAEAGFDHHLVKPPEPQAVEAVLAALTK